MERFILGIISKGLVCFEIKNAFLEILLIFLLLFNLFGFKIILFSSFISEVLIFLSIDFFSFFSMVKGDSIDLLKLLLFI